MKKIAVFFINIYQSCSFIFPGTCIYIPTCSEYAKKALTEYSLGKALKLICLRIIRCNPFSRGGFDPVK